MSHIFISYSHQDRDYAHRLAAELERRNLAPWIDDRIDYGTAWPDVIEQHIDTCAAFIVVLTPRSKESLWVKNELAYAMGLGKPIFPLLLEGNYWLPVAAIQCVDVRDARLPPHTFYDRLEQVLPTPVRLTPSSLTSETAVERQAAGARSIAESRLLWRWVVGGVLALVVLGGSFLGIRAALQSATTFTKTPTITPAVVTTSPTGIPDMLELAATAISPSPSRVPMFYAEVLADTLNVRSGPGYEFARITQVHQGKCLPVYAWAHDTAWFEIVHSGTSKGWVDAQYVRGDLSSKCDSSGEPPADVSARFWATRTEVRNGECTTLHWEVNGVKAVYLDDIGKPGSGSVDVCPLKTHTYLLRATLRNGQEWVYPLTILCSRPVLPTPTLTPTPTPSDEWPLSIVYEIRNVSCPTGSGYTVEFWIEAKGGTGSYIYYRDLEEIGGPMYGGMSYRLDWGSCNGAPGTFSVKSGGQIAERKFWVQDPACCR